MPCPLHAVAGGARRRESVSISVRPAPGEGTAGQVPRAGWQFAQSVFHLLTASTLPPGPPPPCLQSSLSSPSTLPARSTRRTYSRLSVCLSVSASADQSVSPPPNSPPPFPPTSLSPLFFPPPHLFLSLLISFSVDLEFWLSVCLSDYLSFHSVCLTSFPVK